MSIPTQDPEDATLVEFHCFPKLPIELRLKIWGMTIQPRTVEILWPRCWERDHPAVFHIHAYKCPTPVILHVHRDSREEGLRFYHLSSRDDSNAINQFYFNPALDTLDTGTLSWVQWDLFVESNDCGLLNHVQKIVLEKEVFMFRREGAVKQLAIRLPALREVITPLFPKVDGCLYSQRVETKSKCECGTLSMEEQLNVHLKGHRTFTRNLRRPEKIDRKACREHWKSCSDRPCPDFWTLRVCVYARCWRKLDSATVNRFVAAQASEGN